MRKPLYTIYMQRVANQLEARGFRVVTIEPNKRHPSYFVWKFEDSVELRDALKESANKHFKHYAGCLK